MKVHVPTCTHTQIMNFNCSRSNLPHSAFYATQDQISYNQTHHLRQNVLLGMASYTKPHQLSSVNKHEFTVIATLLFSITKLP